jgi:hypothetical protein
MCGLPIATIGGRPRGRCAVTAQVIQRDQPGMLTKIGQGGQGVVYRAPNVKTKFAASMVYKEYKTQIRADIAFTALCRDAGPGGGLAVLRPGRTADLQGGVAVRPGRRRWRRVACTATPCYASVRQDSNRQDL